MTEQLPPSSSSTTSTIPSYPDIAPSVSAKTVFLIRHAHSMENQRIDSVFNAFGDLGRFSLPKTTDLGASLELLMLEHDAPLSDRGHEQCAIMKKLLQEVDFVKANQIELVVHSPLERAKQTCQELVGCSNQKTLDPPIQNGKNISQSFRWSTTSTTTNSATTTTTSTSPKEEEEQRGSTKPTGTTYPPPVKRVVSLCLLEEKHQLEWVPGNMGGFDKRIIEFQQWLAEQPESVVCVVGHSQYFKAMLQLPFKFDNTDVYQVSFDPQKTTPNEPFVMEDKDGTVYEINNLKAEWYDLKLLHSCRQQQKPKTAQEEDSTTTEAATATTSSTTPETETK